MNLWPIAYKICQNVPKFFQALNKPSKILPKPFKIAPKRRNLAKSGPTASLQPPLFHHVFLICLKEA